jgi:hypothetical protein
MLLPALGRWPAAEVYQPGRMLEYTVFMELLVAAVCVSFLITMAGSLILAIRWWLARPAASAGPSLLMPAGRSMAGILLLGIVLPLFVFFVVTRYLPWTGHNYSVRVAMFRLAAEFGLLTAAVSILPVLLILRHVRRRVQGLGFETPRWHARYLAWPLSLLGALLLVVAWLIPISANDSGRLVASIGLLSVGAAMIAALIGGVAQGLAGQGRHAGFYGASFRTLGTALALVVVVFGVCTRPLLLRAEARYIQRDTLMYDRERVGFTKIESDLVDELRTATLEKFR